MWEYFDVFLLSMRVVSIHESIMDNLKVCLGISFSLGKLALFCLWLLGLTHLPCVGVYGISGQTRKGETGPKWGWNKVWKNQPSIVKMLHVLIYFCAPVELLRSALWFFAGKFRDRERYQKSHKPSRHAPFLYYGGLLPSLWWFCCWFRIWSLITVEIYVSLTSPLFDRGRWWWHKDLCEV